MIWAREDLFRMHFHHEIAKKNSPHAIITASVSCAWDANVSIIYRLVHQQWKIVHQVANVPAIQEWNKSIACFVCKQCKKCLNFKYTVFPCVFQQLNNWRWSQIARTNRKVVGKHVMRSLHLMFTWKCVHDAWSLALHLFVDFVASLEILTDFN